jgi:hypothetical protein
MKKFIDGERAYPIYLFSVRWSQDGKWNPEYPNEHKGLTEGRIWNSTAFYKMYKIERSQKQLNKFIKKWWDEYLKTKENTEKFPIKNPGNVELKAKFRGYETWLLTWFQHETFDIGQSNEEALKSFEKFVERKEILNEKSQWEKNEDAYCLMGAEDRWRWHGAEPDGERETRSAPPCRCKHCKKQGLIRIGH